MPSNSGSSWLLLAIKPPTAGDFWVLCLTAHVGHYLFLLNARSQKLSFAQLRNFKSPCLSAREEEPPICQIDLHLFRAGSRKFTAQVLCSKGNKLIYSHGDWFRTDDVSVERITFSPKPHCKTVSKRRNRISKLRFLK